METIKVAKIKVKKQTDAYTIYEIETDKGVKLDTFEEYKEGDEPTGTITPNEKNPKYNARFAKEKPAGAKRTFTPKDWTAEKKIAALTNAVNMCIHKIIEPKQLDATIDKFFNYLNKK